MNSSAMPCAPNTAASYNDFAADGIRVALRALRKADFDNLLLSHGPRQTFSRREEKEKRFLQT